MATLTPSYSEWGVRRCCLSEQEGNGCKMYAGYGTFNQPNSYYYLFKWECQGDLNVDSSGQTCLTNLRVHLWSEPRDTGYMSRCPGEINGQTFGCTSGIADVYLLSNMNGSSYTHVGQIMTKGTISHTDYGWHNIGGSMCVAAGGTISFNFLKLSACGDYYCPLSFTADSAPDLSECVAPTVSLSCSPSTTDYNAGVLNISGSYGTNIDRWGNDVNTRSTRWTISPGGKTGSSGGTVSGLTPNSNYSVSVTRSNGCASASSSCSFTTLVGNELSNCHSVKSDEIIVDCVIYGGYGVYEPTTEFRYRPHSGGAWQTFFTSKTKTKTTVTLKKLKRNTQYDIQACTTTTAGTYCGNIITCSTTPGAYALITSTEPYIQEYPNNEKPQNTRCTVCYSWEADCAPVDLQVFYRIKNGFDDKWQWSAMYASDQASGTNCITLVDLVPNQTVYECFVRATGCDGVSWDSPLAEFITPLLKQPYNNNCDTLTYMVELICQALEAIKHGNKTIYANAASKEKCDPYSDNPTLSTLWSRFLRWGAGSACLLCDMVDFLVKSGKKNQYFVGEVGWVDIIQKLEDEYDDENGQLLVSSGAVYDKIQEKLHEVWHFHGSVDYIVDDLKSIPDGALIVLNLADNKVYELVDGKWSVSTSVEQPDDFAVYHVNYESSTKGLGTVQAESAWYYWQDTWNNLDFNLDWVTDLIEEAYKHIDEMTTVESGADPLSIRVDTVDEFNCETLTSNPDRIVDFILEEPDDTPAAYHLVTFDTGDGGTIVANQQILDGALAQQPENPEKNCMSFVEWQENGVVFDWSQPIYADHTLTAVWNAEDVQITFGIGDADGVAPDAIDGVCGDAIGTLPNAANFSKTGSTFVGWAIDGVPIDSDYVLEGNATATPIWKTSEITVTFVLNNGEENIVKQVGYNQSTLPPADPTRTDYVFVGWFTDATTNTPWEQDTMFTSNTFIYAGWVDATYTVTFDTDGGSTIEPQQVGYKDTATKPTDPTKEGYRLKEWQLEGEVYDFSAPVTENITLTAVWEKVWTVSYDADGGEPEPDDEIVLDGEMATEPEEPTKEDCEFQGWEEEVEEPEEEGE